LSPFSLRPIAADQSYVVVIVGRRVARANTNDSSVGQPVIVRVAFGFAVVGRSERVCRVIVALRWSSSKRVRRKSAKPESKRFYRTLLRHNRYSYYNSVTYNLRVGTWFLNIRTRFHIPTHRQFFFFLFCSRDQHA